MEQNNVKMVSSFCDEYRKKNVSNKAGKIKMKKSNKER
jgi:hypothetical protein